MGVEVGGFVPEHHLVRLVGDQEAGSSVFTSVEEFRGRQVRVVVVAGRVSVGSDRASDAAEGPLPTSWADNFVPLSARRLDMLIAVLQVARLQAFGTPLAAS